MQKAINDTAGRLGRAMRGARRDCRLCHEDAARLLRVSPNELLEYESGTKNIPTDVFVHVFIMGYKMMEVRTLASRYRCHRKAFR